MALRGGRAPALLAAVLAMLVLASGCKKQEAVRTDADFYRRSRSS
jgi:hypothetical protein